MKNTKNSGKSNSTQKISPRRPRKHDKDTNKSEEKHSAIRIRSVNDLPDWFELSKYENAKDLDATGWLTQFAIRKELPLFLNFEKSLHERISAIDSVSQPSEEINFEHDDAEEVGDYRELIAPIFKQVREQPIIHLSEDNLLSEFFKGGILVDLESGRNLHSLSVHQMTVHELYMIERSLRYDPAERREHILNYVKYSNSADGKVDDRLNNPYERWMDDPIDDINQLLTTNIEDLTSSQISIRVDLAASDHILHKQFKSLLKELRERYGRNKNRMTYTLWHERGVLPYMDLQLWAEENNIKISDQALCDAIYPQTKDSSESPDGLDSLKTTRRMASEMVTENYLQRLSALAFEEKSAMQL